MKKVLSMVLTIVMLVSIFSTVLNLREVSAAPKNPYAAILPKKHEPIPKPTKSVIPTQNVTPVSTPTLRSVAPVTSSLTPEIVTSTPTASSSEFTVDLGTINASTNEYINVPLSFRNVPEKGILSFNMTINYDPDCLEYLAYETGSIVPDPDINFAMSANSKLGYINLLFLDYDMEDFGVKSDGLVANLKFKVLNKSDISTPIRITTSTFGDHDLNHVIPKFVQGKVNISGTSVVTPIPDNEFTVKIGSGNALVGDKITIPVTFSNIPSKGITSFDMTIAYDSNKLKYLSFDAGNIVDNPDNNFSMNKPHDGLLKLLFLDYTLGNEAINSNGTVVNLTFNVLESNSESTSINVTDSAFCDVDINPVNTATVPGVVNVSRPLIQTPTPTQTSKLTLNVGSAEGKAGDVVKVPISLVNVPSTAINNVYCKFSYDRTKLKFMPDESEGFIRGMLFGDDWVNGEANLIFYKNISDSDLCIKEDGQIAYLTFKILGPYSEAAPIKLDYNYFTKYTDNSLTEEKIDALINSGSVNIIGAPLPTQTLTPTPTPTLQINVGSVKGETGDLVTVPVSLKNVPENGIGCANMIVKYDPSLLKCVSYEPGNIVQNPELNFDKGSPSEGDIRFLYTVDINKGDFINKDGVFANITFKVLGEYNKSTLISISDMVVGDIDLNAMPCTTVSGYVDILGNKPAPGFQVKIGSAKGAVGEYITIPVSFSNIPSRPICTFNMTLNYDPNMLEYVSYEVGSNVKYPSTNFALSDEPDGKIKMLYLNYTMESGINISVDGDVVKLTFKVLSPGESTIYASESIFGDTNLEKVTPVLVPGQISLTETPLITEKIKVYAGGYLQGFDILTLFPISLSNVPSTGIKSVNMTIEYDPTITRFVDVISMVDEKLGYAKDITIQKVSESSFKILYDASIENDFIYDGLFAYLCFDVLTTSTNDISFKVKDVTFVDKYGNPVGAEIISQPVAKLSIGIVKALEGSTVVVPVKLDSLPQEGIEAAEMFIEYDTEVLEYVSYKAGSIIPNPARCRVDLSEYDKNKLILHVDTISEPITTNGDLGYLTFKVKDGNGFSPIKFSFVAGLLTPLGDMAKVSFITNGGVEFSDEESIANTVSGCVYSDLANINLSNYSFNEGFKVELVGTAFSAMTDSNGYFEIKNVPIGKYTVAITKANCLERRLENISVDKDKVLSTASNPITLWSGDIDENGKHDGAINLEDIMEICKAFNSVSGDGKYKVNLDLNKDSAINLEDIMIIAKNFNKCSSDYQ